MVRVKTRIGKIVELDEEEYRRHYERYELVKDEPVKVVVNVDKMIEKLADVASQKIVKTFIDKGNLTENVK